MPESLIRENLNELEKYIVYFNKENVISMKSFYADKIVELLFPFKTVSDKLNEEELKRIRKIINEAEEIIKATYPIKNPMDNKDYLSDKLSELEELRIATRKILKKDLKEDEQLQERIKELKEELKSQVRIKDGIYIKRDIFKIMKSISSIRLYKDIYDENGKFIRISPENMVYSAEETSKLMYIREELAKSMKEFAEEIYFEKDPSYKMIIEGRKQGIKTSGILELVEYLEKIEELNENSFEQVTMNEEELELVKEKLRSLTTKKIKTELNNLPANVERIVEEFKRTMDKENYEELVRHSLIVDTLKIESFSRERLTSAELSKLKGTLKYIFGEKIEKAKKQEEKKSKQEPTKKAKIDNFKYHWLSYQERASKEEKIEHIKGLSTLKRNSIYGIELSEEELQGLKAELLKEGSKGLELNAEQINELVEETSKKSEEIQVEVSQNQGSKEEQIQKYIEERIEELSKLPEEAREEVLNNLEVQIEGITLTQDEINSIKQALKVVLPPKEVDIEKVRNLFSEASRKINEMSHEVIQRELSKAMHLTYEQSDLKEQLTEEEFKEYQSRWINALKEANVKYHLANYIEIHKLETLSIEELERYQIDENELLTLGLTEEEIQLLKRKIENKKEHLLQLNNKKIEKMNDLFSENSKIEFLRYGKPTKGRIKGYQLISSIEGKSSEMFFTKEEVIKFLKSHPDYSFEKDRKSVV